MVTAGVYDVTRFRVTAAVDGEVMAVIVPSNQCLVFIEPSR